MPSTNNEPTPEAHDVGVGGGGGARGFFETSGVSITSNPGVMHQYATEAPPVDANFRAVNAAGMGGFYGGRGVNGGGWKANGYSTPPAGGLTGVWGCPGVQNWSAPAGPDASWNGGGGGGCTNSCAYAEGDDGPISSGFAGAGGKGGDALMIIEWWL
jgi:hypothetical protein